MNADNTSRLKTELEYLQQRQQELTIELDGNVRELTALADRAIDALRRSGNESLATEWSAAIAEWRARHDRDQLDSDNTDGGQ